MTADAGRALWRCLHAYAFTFPELATEDDRERAEQWLEWFAQAVDEASGQGCSCARHWRGLCAETPPKLRGRVEFWEWTVEMHNRANAKLGKAEMRYP
jgi:hypothetical protein